MRLVFGSWPGSRQVPRSRRGVAFAGDLEDGDGFEERSIDTGVCFWSLLLAARKWWYGTGSPRQWRTNVLEPAQAREASSRCRRTGRLGEGSKQAEAKEYQVRPGDGEAGLLLNSGLPAKRCEGVAPSKQIGRRTGYRRTQRTTTSILVQLYSRSLAQRRLRTGIIVDVHMCLECLECLEIHEHEEPSTA